MLLRKINEAKTIRVDKLSCMNLKHWEMAYRTEATTLHYSYHHNWWLLPRLLSKMQIYLSKGSRRSEHLPAQFRRWFWSMKADKALEEPLRWCGSMKADKAFEEPLRWFGSMKADKALEEGLRWSWSMKADKAYEEPLRWFGSMKADKALEERLRFNSSVGRALKTSEQI